MKACEASTRRISICAHNKKRPNPNSQPQTPTNQQTITSFSLPLLLVLLLLTALLPPNPNANPLLPRPPALRLNVLGAGAAAGLLHLRGVLRGHLGLLPRAPALVGGDVLGRDLEGCRWAAEHCWCVCVWMLILMFICGCLFLGVYFLGGILLVLSAGVGRVCWGSGDKKVEFFLVIRFEV